MALSNPSLAFSHLLSSIDNGRWGSPDCEVRNPGTSIVELPPSLGLPLLVDSGDDSSAVTFATKRSESSDLVDTTNKRPKLEVEATLICRINHSDDHDNCDGDDRVC